jgi:hypothetical protein
VPLHRLPQHRQGGAAGRRLDGKMRTMPWVRASKD